MIYTSYAEGRQGLAGICPISCGHIFAEAGREICRPAGRPDWLLFYVEKESEVFYFDGERTVAEAGSFVLFAPGQRQHHAYIGNRTAEFYYVHFSCEELPAALSLPTSKVLRTAYKKAYAELFEGMIEQALKKEPHYEAVMVSRLLMLLATVKQETESVEHSASGGMGGVARAIQHMNRYCDAPLRLEDYATMCCMSKYHFLRRFSAVTGQTPLEYRSRIRIEHAKELLSDGMLTVSQISAALGYSSPAYFSDSFKKAVGVSPKEWKKG